MSANEPLHVVIERDSLGGVKRATITNDGITRDVTGQIDCIEFRYGSPVGTLKWIDPKRKDDRATVEVKAAYRKRRRKPKSAAAKV